MTSMVGTSTIILRQNFDFCFPVLTKKIQYISKESKGYGKNVDKWCVPELANKRSIILTLCDMSKSRPHLNHELRCQKAEYNLVLKEALQSPIAVNIAKEPNQCKVVWDQIKMCKIYCYLCNFSCK